MLREAQRKSGEENGHGRIGGSMLEPQLRDIMQALLRRLVGIVFRNTQLGKEAP